LLTALVPAMWAYNGFNDLATLVKKLQPSEEHPTSHNRGLLTVGGLYLLANVVYFRILPFATLLHHSTLPRMWCRRLPDLEGDMVDVSDAISALGALHVVVLTGARIPYAMARDGVFFPFASEFTLLFAHPAVR